MQGFNMDRHFSVSPVLKFEFELIKLTDLSIT